MSNKNVIDLYELLPALYRLRDAERGYPLREVLEIIYAQAEIVKQNIDGLWDDMFIETCADWVIPYVGDLVGNNPLHEVAARHRADVAKTISYRRRKATLPMLEELARDVTGWHAHAVAFFELLGWTQNLNHLRFQEAPVHDIRDPIVFDRVGTVNLRNMDALDRLNEPFDVICHTVDVRPISRTEGWYNIPKIGFFLLRLRHNPLTGITARQASVPNGFHFSTLSNPAPLFNNPKREADPTGLASELHVPGPIRPVAFHFDPEDYYGPDRSLAIYRGPRVAPDRLVPLSEIMCKDLSAWAEPPNNKVAVDVRLGRLAFASGEVPADGVTVSYNYGFSADSGGGPYDRRQALADPSLATWEKTVGQRDPNVDFDSLDDALTAWADPNDGNKANAIITITDNGTYTGDITIEPLNDRWLAIQAEDGNRPTLRFVDAGSNLANLVITGGNSATAAFTLNGLLIEGGIHVEQNSLGQLRVIHCTLVPGRGLDERGVPQQPDRPSVTVKAPNSRLCLEIDHSIVGSLRLPAEIADLKVRDSIIDSPTRDRPARRVPALISGDLVSFPTLSSTSPAVNITVGGEGPRTATLPGSKPTNLEESRDQLQVAIRNAHGSRVFTDARVITVDNRLAVLPGVAEVVTIEAAGADPTATELKLDRPSARQVYALVTGALPPSFILSSTSPKVNVTIGEDGPHTGKISAVPGNPAQARDQLQEAIRSAHDSQAFKDALVGSTEDNRLVVLPGTDGVAVTFSRAPDDETTLKELALESDRPAIAFSDGGELPGPLTTLERTTIFGKVHLKELILASEVIFAEPVVSERRQAGCIRFSHVPEGSQTPPRYRCQPDLALENVIDPARQASILARLTPSFTSVHYGHPAYCQLSLNCAGEIRNGAEDGSEMGVFSNLKQPQRETNLRVRLEEYLPFDLEAGLIYVT
jgi:hypothetical protein